MMLAILVAGLGTLALAPADTMIVEPTDAGTSIVAASGSDTSSMQSDTATATNAAPGVVQPEPTEGTEDMPGAIDFVTNLPTDWIDWAQGTANTEHIPIIAGIGIATAALLVIDDEVHSAIRHVADRSADFRRASDAAVFIGDGKFQFGVAALFGAWGLVTNDTRAVRTASRTAEVILACGGVVQLLKHLTGRQRPSEATTPTGRWALLPNPVEYHRHVPRYDAFPSGHLSTATATLTVIMQSYPEATWLPWVGVPALGMLAVGLSASGMHWWSDFPLALAIGYTFGRLVASRPVDGRTSVLLPDNSPTLHVTRLSDGTPSIGVAWHR